MLLKKNCIFAHISDYFKLIESMTITISSDEPSTIDRVLHLLRREKVDFDIKKTKKDVLDDLKDAVAEVRRKDLTGEQGQTFEEFLEEFEAELDAEKHNSHAY